MQKPLLTTLMGLGAPLDEVGGAITFAGSGDQELSREQRPTTRKFYPSLVCAYPIASSRFDCEPKNGYILRNVHILKQLNLVYYRYILSVMMYD